MSGIAGIVHFGGDPAAGESIRGMTAALAHRGPDGSDHWREGFVAFGHCMFRTTAEAIEERQPLTSADRRLTLVMDGRLDNWEELRAALTVRGARLRDRSDAELVLHAYETWGEDCPGHLDGAFAFAVWDAPRQALFCARDRMGLKPFTYHWDGTRLSFASELHALLDLPWIRPELNEGLVAEYLALDWYSREETLWSDVLRLPPAHAMTCRRESRRLREYWRPELAPPLGCRTGEEYAEHYRHLLADAVRRSSRSHRPVACEVSGGLDSSAVFAVAADLLRRRELPAPGLAAYTLRFDEEPDADELAYARAVSRHVGLPVHDVAPTVRPLAWYLDGARAYREFPAYPNGVMGWGIRDTARRDGCRALLVGIGGDEWLSGSRASYVEELAAGRWRALVDCVRADVRDCGLRAPLATLARAFASLALPPPLRRAVSERRHRARSRTSGRHAWLAPRLQAALPRAAATGPADARASRAGQARLLSVLYDAYGLLARESEERLAARAGIELRLPLFGSALVQFAFSTPERLRQRGRTTKALHRSAMTGLLPAPVLERASKADFMVTFRYHAGEIRGMFTPQQRDGLDDWVRREDLDAACDRYGDPRSDGLAEWRLWSLAGCLPLRHPAQGRAAVEPAPLTEGT